MDSLTDRLRRSYVMRGFWGTTCMCAGSLLELVRPAARRLEKQRQQTDVTFDFQNGINTGGIFRPRAHAVIGRNWSHGISYQAIDPASFVQVLDNLKLVFADFTFIDYGSGKGRALLLAAGYPFQRIIGVDYCEELNRIARCNLLAHPQASRRPGLIEVVSADAAEYPIPKGPLVLYFYHPFGRPVMEKVANNVAQSLRHQQRRVVIIYFTPYFADVWEATSLFKRLNQSPAIFDNAGRIN